MSSSKLLDQVRTTPRLGHSALNRKAGVLPASQGLWVETFSLQRSLSSPQQPFPIAPHFYPFR